MSARTLAREERIKYSNDEKVVLAELVYKVKEEYDAEFKPNEGKTKFDAQRKRISIVRNNPQESSDDTEDHDGGNILKILRNM